MFTKVAALTLLPVALMGGVVANSSIMLVELSITNELDQEGQRLL